MSEFLNIKEKLAKLLATENLDVRFNSSAQTASFEPESRVLTIPILKSGLNNAVYNLFIAHEASHALYSPVDSIQNVKDLGIPLDVANVVEDVRIEKLIQQRYPGLRKDFREGYHNLHEQNFFGTQGKNLESYSFLDRVNLHYKLGSLAMIPFSDEEKEYVELVDTCKTFDDVIKVSQTLIQFVKEQKEKEQEEQESLFKSQQSDNGHDSEDSGEDENVEENTVNDVTSSNEESTESSQSNSEKSSGTESNTPNESTGLSDSQPVDDFVSETQRNFNDNLNQQVDTSTRTHIISTPKSSVWDHFIPVSYVRECIKHNPVYMNRVKYHYNKYRTNSKSEVNFMVQQFQMKKSADEYRRSSVSRSGVLDMNRVHNYRIDDDIFSRNMVLPEGKNHGMYMLLDFSGSMAEMMRGVIRQTLTLVQFCRKVGIPFEVVAFSNTTDARCELIRYHHPSEMIDRSNIFMNEYEVTSEEKNYLTYGSLTLIQLISSDATARQIDQDMFNLFAYSMNIHDYPILSLGGTPLDISLIGMMEILPEFKNKHNLEKVTLVTLTDGDSHGVETSVTTRVQYSSRAVYKNTHNKQTYLTSYHNSTSVFLNMLQDYLPDIKFVNFFIGSRAECFRYTYSLNMSIADASKMKSQLKKESSFYYEPKNKTYDSIVFISNSVFYSDEELQMEDNGVEQMTKSQLRKSFNSMIKKRGNSIKVLSEFMSLVS
jgi:hypothetical protein